METSKLTDGTLVFPPSKEGKSAILNALAFAESPQQVVAFLAKSADVALSPEQVDAAAAVYVTLPPNATIRDFVSACDQDAARKLGIPVERIEVLGPLIAALEETTKPGRYNGLFDGGNVADCPITG